MRTIALLGLASCAYMGDRRYREQVQDQDGDGVLAERFGGADCMDHDPTVQQCDADGDGYRSIAAGGDDCDDEDPAVHPGVVYHADTDADGFGDPDAPVTACGRPPGTVEDLRDCDDATALVNPAAVEECDDLDRDCDGDPYAGADGSLWYLDRDGDGWGVDERGPVATCFPEPGEANRAGDCDDADPDTHPGAVEVWYDGRDTDCDGEDDDDQDGDGSPAVLDCDDTDAARHPDAPELCNGLDDDCDQLVDDDDADTDQLGQLPYFLDADRDGHGGASVTASFCPAAVPSGWALSSDDCDDGDPTAHPGATEVCDLVDDDCNGAPDDGAVDARALWQDLDGDGWGGAAVVACYAGAGIVALGGDCDDGDPVTYPGAPEICGDVLRQDCTALSPDDCDGDGYASALSGGTDCDDQDPGLSPDETEVCDGVDNDCDGFVDSADPSVDVATYTDWYLDLDGDGFGIDVLVAAASCEPPAFAASNTLDCDDSRALVLPGAPEACNGRDDDCDGVVDEEPSSDVPVYHADADGDGAGDPVVTSAEGCDPPAGAWVLDGSDCDDLDPAQSPFLPESCNGRDDDCDDLVDDADTDVAGTPWYLDQDGDGAGVVSAVVIACAPPASTAQVPGDCDDLDPAVHPGQTETCNGGVDDDCDGLADDQDPDLAPSTTFYADADLDGFGDPLAVVVACVAPAGTVQNPLDCDDTRIAVSPLALEVCDGLDDDCDGLVDAADPLLVGGVDWYPDGDLDGLGTSPPVPGCGAPTAGYAATAGDCDDGDPSAAGAGVWFADVDLDGYAGADVFVVSCAPGAGWSTTWDDCRDADPLVHPGAADLCDGVDQDCDAQVDEDGAMDPAAPIWFADADGDGHGAGPGTPSCGPLVGSVLSGDDCDDADASVHPGAALERCDGRDDDCDGAVDAADPDSVVLVTPWFTDPDADGYGSGLPTYACGLPAGGPWVAVAGDCGPLDPTISPAADETCDGVDDDCDGLVDAYDPSVDAACPAPACVGAQWPDADGDGFGDRALVPYDACDTVPGFVANGDDCDDTDPLVVPLLVVVSTRAELEAQMSTTSCRIAELAAGFDQSVDLNAVDGMSLTIRSADPAAPGVLRQVPGKVLLDVNNDDLDGTFELQDLRLVGTSNDRLVNLNGLGSQTVAFVRVDLDGAGVSSGIELLNGIHLSLVDVTLTDMVAGTGSAIRLFQEASLDLHRVVVERAAGTALDLELGTDNLVVQGLSVVDSGPARLYGPGPGVPQQAGLAPLRDLEIQGATGDGLKVETDVGIHGVLVAGAAATGIRCTQDALVSRATVVGNGGPGVSADVGAVDVVDSIVAGNPIDLSVSLGAILSTDHVLFGSATGQVAGTSLGSDPGFVTFDAALDPLLFELHLAPGSAAAGAASDGDDLGAFRAGDDWYRDDDADGLPDGWESRWLGDPAAGDPAADDDADGLDAAAELALGTVPVLSDTDGDGLTDDADAAPLTP